jgi:hypothetical protein
MVGRQLALGRCGCCSAALHIRISQATVRNSRVRCRSFTFCSIMQRRVSVLSSILDSYSSSFRKGLLESYNNSFFGPVASHVAQFSHSSLRSRVRSSTFSSISRRTHSDRTRKFRCNHQSGRLLVRRNACMPRFRRSRWSIPFRCT